MYLKFYKNEQLLYRRISDRSPSFPKRTSSIYALVASQEQPHFAPLSIEQIRL